MCILSELNRLKYSRWFILLLKEIKMIEMTLGAMLRQKAMEDPDQEFMVYSDRDLRFTYKEFDERVDDLAKGLIAIGIKKGDNVGIWAINVPDWLTFLFAVARIGAVFVTINTNYKISELEYLVKQSDITTLCLSDGFRDSDYVEMVRSIIPEVDECERGFLKSKKFPCLKNIIYIEQEKHRGMFSTQEIMLLGQHVDKEVLYESEKQVGIHDIVNMQYTSGTTGFPKGVMLTHYNIINNGYYIGESMKYTSAERVCLPVPLFHCFGIVLGVMAVLSHGATHVMLEKFDPLLTLASIDKEKCTALYGVPTMFIEELHHPMFKMFDMSSLRTGIMAGSQCPVALMKQVVEEMNMKDITSVYGLTEASPGMTQSTADDPLDMRVSTVGKELPFIDVKVLDPKTLEECPAGTVGEMCCKGYNIMKGYYKMPEETEKIIDKNGYLHSGDLGIRTKEGYFKITGRIKDMIIRGGENIYPMEVEEFLRNMPEIKDVQVAAIEDEKYGEAVGAFIILKEGASLKEEDIKDFCKGKISRFKIPKHIFFIDEFPMTGSRKIQKFKLSEMGLEMLKKREEKR